MQVSWPATVSQPLQREGRRAGTSLALPQAPGKPVRDVREAQAWRQYCPFCLQSTFVKGFRALQEGGFAWMGTPSGWFMSHPLLPVSVQGDERRRPVSWSPQQQQQQQ